ncbi:MAG: hypothetical protein WC182_07630 [Bacilli bacterium]
MNTKQPPAKKKKKIAASFNRYDMERDRYEDFYQSKYKQKDDDNDETEVKRSPSLHEEDS